MPVRWLSDEAVEVHGLPLQMVGMEFLDANLRTPDILELAAACGQLDRTGTNGALRVVLCHYSEWLPTADDLGADLMFSGHTHGGQLRLPGGRALKNCCELPLHLTCGMLRHRDTVCVVSRGLGEARIRLRLFCPPHVPLITLQRGALPGDYTDGIDNVRKW